MAGADQERFRELYDRTYNRVYAFVLRRVTDETAADVVADTYLAVWRRIRDVPLETRMADAWVFKTAYRVLANSRRGTKRRTALVDRIRQRPVDSQFINVHTTTDTETALNRALARLRPEQREIIAFRYWDDLDTDQIARIMGISKNAAAVRLSRAQHALRAAFDESRGDRDDTGDEGGEL